MKNGQKKIDNLPSSDDEFWDGERAVHTPKPINICRTHTVGKFMKHTRYIDNQDGTISCEDCPWGTRLPGYLRVEKGKLVDLRKLAN